MATETATGGPCLSCRRPLTMRAHLNEGRGLYVCLGHPPRVHRDILTAVMAAEADGHKLSERFGTLWCPGCDTSTTLGQVHTPGSDACRVMAHEAAVARSE